MTIDPLRRVHRATPVQAFTLHLADGRAIQVRHPEYLAQSPSGRTVVVYDDYDASSIIDLPLVTEIEIHGTAPQGEVA